MLLSNWKLHLVKSFQYGLILSLAIAIGGILYTIPSSQWLISKIVKIMSHVIKNNSQSLISSYAVSFWLFSLVIGGMIALNSLIVINLLKFFKPQWLPSGDAALAQVNILNRWMNLISLTGIIYLSTQALEFLEKFAKMIVR